MNQLRTARQSRGWTQARAAARLGVSQPYLAMLEAGQRPLTSAVARRAMRVYGLPPTPNDRGAAINFKDCQVRFRLAWARIRPTLTDEAIQTATRQAEGLLEEQAAKEAKPKAAEPLQVLENHRAAPRHRVLKAGSIEFNGGVIDCTIRNVSDTGAALEVASPVGVPDSFWLVVSGDHTRRHCRVAWRTDKRIGVAFD